MWPKNQCTRPVPDPLAVKGRHHKLFVLSEVDNVEEHDENKQHQSRYQGSGQRSENASLQDGLERRFLLWENVGGLWVCQFIVIDVIILMTLTGVGAVSVSWAHRIRSGLGNLLLLLLLGNGIGSPRTVEVVSQGQASTVLSVLSIFKVATCRKRRRDQKTSWAWRSQIDE